MGNNKHLISFDIGIKNLSYCVLDSSENIIQWGIINMCNETYICCYQDCNYKASYILREKCYCKTHLKKENKNINAKEVPKEYYKLVDGKKVGKRKMNELRELCKVGKIEDITNENLINILREKMIIEIKKKNAKDVNLIEIGTYISKNLPKIVDIEIIDKAIIESQIGPLANRMAIIQGMLAQFFIDHNKPVEFVSPSNKLKKFNVNKDTYKNRKQASIVVTRELVENHDINKKWLDYFERNKKKDDLADAYLQGIWFLRK